MKPPVHTTPSHRPRQMGEVATPMLRLVAGNPAAAKALPFGNICDMASELLARRGADGAAGDPTRENRKADAILAALQRNFIITGNHSDVWRIRTVSDVLLEELRVSGFHDATAQDVYVALCQAVEALDDALILGKDEDQVVLRGLRAEGGQA